MYTLCSSSLHPCSSIFKLIYLIITPYDFLIKFTILYLHLYLQFFIIQSPADKDVTHTPQL